MIVQSLRFTYRALAITSKSYTPIGFGQLVLNVCLVVGWIPQVFDSPNEATVQPEPSALGVPDVLSPHWMHGIVHDADSYGYRFLQDTDPLLIGTTLLYHKEIFRIITLFYKS